jgi:hypothetical protein
MRGKAALLVGLATGYVLGTRDGRARYQQIKTQANRFISDPRVQQKTAQATDLAKEKAPLVKDKISEATGKATSKVSSKGSSSSGSESDLPRQTTTSAPDLTHTSTGTDSSSATLGAAGVSGTSETSTRGSVHSGDSSVSGVSGDSGDSRGSGESRDSGDEDAIVLTPPSPSPLAPGPTETNPSTGGSNG